MSLGHHKLAEASPLSPDMKIHGSSLSKVHAVYIAGILSEIRNNTFSWVSLGSCLSLGPEIPYPQKSSDKEACCYLQKNHLHEVSRKQKRFLSLVYVAMEEKLGLCKSEG